MQIKINGEKKEIAKAQATVSDVLAYEQVKNPDTIAVQINGAFLNKEAYATTHVKEGDEVEFVYFMGGGR